MNDEQFDVVFFGILQAGKDKETVMQNMATLFKTDANKLAPYFAGGRKVIKGKINAEAAKKYVTALENVGLVVKLEACDATEETSASKSSPSPETPAIDTGDISVAPVGADFTENLVEVPAQKIDDISDISMAEAGVDVIENPVIVPAQAIDDISDISMAEVGVNVIENPATKPVQEIEELSGVTLAEAGADMIENPEPVKKADVPDTSELSLED
ncbi:hypothetical protein MNBD_GAMMA05-409 [hydrothermal vent metagenome]|uniref:Uncharacterized protein n=1 Tax=hydrothermal vent metagenome TaxID=652676 RepID=A0A3B0WSC0_9ZZZZ